MAAKNRLYFGDNLDVLRGYVGDESVDLVYLDPPFPRKSLCCTQMCGPSRPHPGHSTLATTAAASCVSQAD